MKSVLNVFVFLSCLFLATPTFVSAQEDAEKPLEILFVGNSYTYFNSLNETVGKMLDVSGVATNTSRIAPGGWSFKRHFNGETPNGYKGVPTPEKIKEKKWDYVVLQEQSSGAVDHHDEFMEYGQKLVELVRENNPETTIILYAPWGRCDGMFEGYGDDETRKEEVVAAWTKRYGAPNEKTLAQLKTGQYGAYQELQKRVDSLLAPVGKAFLEVGDEMDLYGDEGAQKPYHPNERGSYLAACVFFKTITGQSPVGLWKKLSDAGKDCKVNEEDATRLEIVADKVVE